MKTRKLSRILAALVTIAAFILGLGMSAQAQTETTLFNFPGGFIGGQPESDLIMDSAGNLYSTTWFGGGTASKCDTSRQTYSPSLCAASLRKKSFAAAASGAWAAKSCPEGWGWRCRLCHLGPRCSGQEPALPGAGEPCHRSEGIPACRRRLPGARWS